MTADDIEYINDGTIDDDLDVWMEMLEDYHKNGRIIQVLISSLKFLTKYFERVQNPNRWWEPYMKKNVMLKKKFTISCVISV